MADKTLAEEIITIVENTANNNPAPEHGRIINTYSDGKVDIQLTTTGDILKYLPTIGDNSVGAEGVVCYLNGDLDNQIMIVDNARQNEIQLILALGLGLFTIREDGHLWVELPMNTLNFFQINNEGHLIVTLPEDTNNDYELLEKNLIYHRGG